MSHAANHHHHERAKDGRATSPSRSGTLANVRVLLAIPELMLRQALAAVLTTSTDLRVIGDVGTGHEALRWALGARPDVTVLDEGLAPLEGFSVAAILRVENPSLRVVTLRNDGEPGRNDRGPDDDVAARVSKSLGIDALVNVLLRVAAGERPGDVPAARPSLPLRSPVIVCERLTPAERALLSVLADGANNHELACVLGCSEKTIRNRLSEIYAKLHLRNRTQAALYALRSGLARLERPARA